MDRSLIINVLRKEIEKTIGCTDPVAVSLSVAVATKALGELPESIEVEVSPNIYKNTVSVGVPGTGKRGLSQAVAVGALLADWADENLHILDHVNDTIMEHAQTIINNDRIKIICLAEPPDLLYIKAGVQKGKNRAWAVIRNDYSNVVEIGNGDKVTMHSSNDEKEKSVKEFITYDVRDLVEAAQKIELQELRFLISAALINKGTALEGIKSDKTKLGPVLSSINNSGLEFPYSAMQLAKLYTAAAAEARMIGLKVPIMAIAGSGNHGITNFLGVLAAAETLKSSDLQLARALAISSAITVYIKGYIGRMTAFCGCAVATAIGVAAATVYLLDGDFEDMVHAMHSIVGGLAGIVCDGAKETCAYKVSTAASSAIEYAYLAKEKKVSIPIKME